MRFDSSAGDQNIVGWQSGDCSSLLNYRFGDEPGPRVRVPYPLPVLGYMQQIKLLSNGEKKRILFYFPLVVKWYNSRLITGHYKFDSCREDQFSIPQNPSMVHGLDC